MKQYSYKNNYLIFEKIKIFLLSKLSFFFKNLASIFVFMAVVLLYVFNKILFWILTRRFWPKVVSQDWTFKINQFYTKIMDVIDPEKISSFNRSYLVELSIQNMKLKKTRTVVTMGGMAIGIAFIVFLVSIGYGLQNLVVSRVARLDELKQADVTPGLTDDLVLNEATMSKFSNIPNVKKTIPVISVVGKVSYKESISDMAVYGVTTDYLKNSAIQPIKGKVFDDNNNISVVVSSGSGGQVAGETTENKIVKKGDNLGEIEYQIEPSAWVKVREDSSSKSKLIGYTRKIEGKQSGTELVGTYYQESDELGVNLLSADGNKLSKWIKTKIPIWQKMKCDQNVDSACEDGNYLPLMNDTGGQEQVEGYIAEILMKIVSDNSGSVLGITTDNKVDGSLPMVNIASESAISTENQNKLVEISNQAKRVALVNRSVLQVLNLSEAEAVGKKISLSFVVLGELMENQKEKLQSVPVDYTIVGVNPDVGTPVIYVPFIDLRSLGVNRFSQIKLVVNDPTNLAKVRATLGANGYATVSVADTVAQIDKLFVSLRMVLAILGTVALAVAALGMFNTLTVSLLERTREVGLMKAMGMKSSEVKELFLTESMIMGFFGGILGLIAGAVFGQLISLLLSVFSVIKGVGMVNISYIPPTLIITVLLLSIFVGMLTGYFPAKRATKISALNALRYE